MEQWKVLMLQILREIKEKYPHSLPLLMDLRTIISNVPEANFIQTALEIQPFKPDFELQKITDSLVTRSTTVEENRNVARFEEDNSLLSGKTIQKERITEKTLTKHFMKEFHPYYFIFNNFARLLELKFKQIIEEKNLKEQDIQNLLVHDLKIFKLFFMASSKPYTKLFYFQAEQEEQTSLEKLEKFLETFLNEHPRINSSIHKISLSMTKKTINALQSKKLIETETLLSRIPDDFQIEGCYLRSLNSLIEFSASKNTPQESLEKLLEFRSNILKDIDDYNLEHMGSPKDLSVSAEIQIEIIRFLVSKLNFCMHELYARLKMLEIVFGEDEIAYKYESISFMYTQLIFAFEILQNEQEL